MSEPDRVIAQRELRNDVGAVLREVEAGARVRVTVNGREVADIVPIQRRRTWVPWREVVEMIERAPLDPGFEKDVAEVLGETIDEIEDPFEKR
jgi:prevent-host-death family protein